MLLCMLEKAVKGALCLLEVLEVAPEVMRSALFCMLEAVEGTLCP